MLVNYIEIFSKDNLAVIVTCFTDKGWTVTWITKEFQARSGISEASVGFLTMISSSCKTVLRHTVPKQLKIFFEHARFHQLTRLVLHSPDLNPLDYSIWDMLQELVYEGRHEPFANLKDLDTVIRDKLHDVDD